MNVKLSTTAIREIIILIDKRIDRYSEDMMYARTYGDERFIERNVGILERAKDALLNAEPDDDKANGG